MASRRDFLKLAGAFVAGLAVGGAAGYYSAPGAAQPKPTPTPAAKRIKAGWIYVGPIGDYGWTHAHDIGRKESEKAFPWLETVYVENIDEAKCEGAIEEFIDKGCTVIFTTSFDHMKPTYRAAEKHPDILFFHCSGYMRRPNMATYFADFYQIYYLNGLMAGALTKSNILGYVAAHLIPEVIRHINAFAIGALEVNPNVKVYVIRIGRWYWPEMAREAARTLVEMGADVLAFTEDSPATIEFAQSYYKEKGRKIPVFSHYSPMYEFGPDVVVSGQVVRWGTIYKDILAKVYAGMYTNTNLENVDYWCLLNSGAVDVGGKTYEDKLWINPAYEEVFSRITVTEKYTGARMSLLDLIKLRYSQMSDPNPTFDPFTGPLRGRWWLSIPGTCLGREYKPGEEVSVPPGVRLGHDDLWNMGWFLENVVVQKK